MAFTFPRHLKVATVRMPTEQSRYEMITSDGTVIHSIESSMSMLLSEILNFTYTFVVPEDFSLGHELKDGNWTGLVGMLHRGECDLAFDTLAVTESRTKAIDYSYPYYISSVTFLTKKPRPLTKDMAIFYPFSYTLWMTLAAFVLVFSLLFIVINFEEKKYVRIFLAVLGSVLGQPLFFIFTSWKKQFIFLSWVIGVGFLINSYKALLLSFLLLTPMKGISTIAELASAVASGTAECITYKGSYLIPVLLGSSEEATRIIGKSLEKNTVDFVSFESFIFNGTEKYSFVGAEIGLRQFQALNFMSKDSFFPMIFGIPISKKFCCKKAVDKVLKRLVEAGLVEKILNDIDSRFYIRDAAKYSEPESEHQLKVNDIEGAVFILIGGNILSLIVFVAEKLFYKKSENCH